MGPGELLPKLLKFCCCGAWLKASNCAGAMLGLAKTAALLGRGVKPEEADVGVGVAWAPNGSVCPCPTAGANGSNGVLGAGDDAKCSNDAPPFDGSAKGSNGTAVCPAEDVAGAGLDDLGESRDSRSIPYVPPEAGAGAGAGFCWKDWALIDTGPREPRALTGVGLAALPAESAESADPLLEANAPASYHLRSTYFSLMNSLSFAMSDPLGMLCSVLCLPM